MKPHSSRTTQRRSAGGMLPVIVLLLLALVIVACVYYQQQQRATLPPATESAELVSDDRILYGGMPRLRADAPPTAEGPVEVLRNKEYMVGYSEERKDPLWSAYRVCHVEHPFNLPRPTGGFLTDDRSAAHVKDRDFARSGYDRGHMTPNSAIAHCYGADAQLETFLLTNICPQSPALNERVWEKLETDERHYADQFEEVWVIDGPVFGDMNHATTHRLAAGISVPDAFYKILIDEEGAAGGSTRGRPRVFSVIMPQDVKGTEVPQQFLTSIRDIENETGLEFLWKLDPATQEALKSKVWPMW